MTGTPEPGMVYRALRAIRPLRALVRSGRRFLERYRLPAWHIEGRERASGQPLALFYAGHLGSRNHILHLAFEDGYVERSAGNVWLWSAWRRAGGADLVVTRLERQQLWLHRSARGFNIPCWIGLEVDLATAERYCSRSSSARSDWRNIQRHALAYEVTRDPARFRWFYDTMYLPYVQHVHGERAMPSSWAELEGSLGQCELLLLRKGDDCIAGTVLYDMGDGGARAWLIGVKQGDLAYAKMGAVAAAYHFMIRHLLNKGYHRLHFGATRAFLHDGVLHFKKKYGPVLVGSDDCVFHLRVERAMAGTGGFLANNPFIVLEGDTYYGNFFVDDVGQAGGDRLMDELRHSYVRGIAEQRVYAIRDVTTASGRGTWPPVPVAVKPASAFSDGAS